MGIIEKLFGRKSTSAAPSTPLREKDNRGTRFDTASVASMYWLARMTSARKDPFLLYTFPTKEAATGALLELPCIHVATDSGNLVCTEVLTFGCYAADNAEYEAFLCGADLRHELWSQAKVAFVRHGGRPKGQGELEPEQTAPSSRMTRSSSGPPAVTFIREDRQNKMGATFVYRIHRAPDAASAMAFLQQQPVPGQLYYIIVETPDGNYCRDVQGIYKE